MQEARSLVVQTLGLVFPPGRVSRTPILARVHVSEADLIHCDLQAPRENIAEIVGALHSHFAGRNYTLSVRPL